MKMPVKPAKIIRTKFRPQSFRKRLGLSNSPVSLLACNADESLYRSLCLARGQHLRTVSSEYPYRARVSVDKLFVINEVNGGRGRDRTYDQSIKSRMLYQLSYASAVVAASLG